VNYFRIIKREHSQTPFGYGSLAGRWNQRNVPMIYASSSVALAMTEYLSIKGTQVLNTEWSLITYSIDRYVPELERENLPVEWDSRPYSLTTQLFGSQWIRSQASVCLKVPSARLLLSAYPIEHNLLMNPFHPDLFTIVNVIRTEDLHFHLNEWATGDR
jgi:RES domain-containing protein